MQDVRGLVEKIRVANHFEYLGPLTRSELFFDRKQELQDSLVVCGQIVKGTVGGVLVLGGRGSGKTSFLIELGRQLTERGISNVKLALDEGMVKTGNEMLLIRTILTELIRASENSGLIEKKLADKILGILGSAAGKIEEVGVDFPGFSIVAKASQEKVETQFPYTVFRDGLLDFLKVISKKGSDRSVQGAILLLDEGDALTLNRNLLQIFRNVFQETPRVGLVVSGSTKLLAQVSDVFSPIPRFFRKIPLGPYPADSVVYDAIEGPMEFAAKELAAQGIKLSIMHRGFDRIVTQITGRLPMEINMLCHFAYDLAAKRAKFLGAHNVGLFMRADRELFDEAIKQLVGAKEYDAFIADLDKNETTCLVLLSKSLESSTVEEITVLVGLHQLGDALQEMSITDIARRIEQSSGERDKIVKLLASINEKSRKHNITVLTSTLIGKPRFAVEDQWVRAYFKYGWSDVDVDLELGLRPRFGGIRVFGDPVAAILHSVLFPRLAECFARGEAFKAHAGPDNGRWLLVGRGLKLFTITYKRFATDSSYHLAFQVKKEADITWLEKIVPLLMTSIEKAELAGEASFRLRTS
jgi:hypothetical protein